MSHIISTKNHNDSKDGGDSPLLERKQSSNHKGWGRACKSLAADESKWVYRAHYSSCPHWVYRMYDAYNLSQRAANNY